MNPLTEQLTHPAFPELAAALRLQSGQIATEWNRVVRESMPQMERLSFDELTDTLQGILNGMAVALASSDPAQIRSLVEAAPLQGLSRFRLRYDVIEVMQEDRLLRATIVRQVECGLARQMTSAEAAVLHAVVDVMLKQSVLALVREKDVQLREATQRELKYLTFLTHDLANHLGAVSMNLQLLRIELNKRAELVDASKAVFAADFSIRETVEGMRRLLEHERLRKTSPSPKLETVDLHAFASELILRFVRKAEAKGLLLLNEISADAVTTTDSAMISLVLQNLLGNAIKYSERGPIHITGESHSGPLGTHWALSVADNGHGIAPEHVRRIFDAVQRGELHGQEGVGLGLAIASLAAKLLGAALTVQSVVGVGSTFTLTLPPVS